MEQGVIAMKPLWMQTLAWIAAIAIAVLLAALSPESPPLPSAMDLLPQGGTTPR
jgi:hypothetical protein